MSEPKKEPKWYESMGLAKNVWAIGGFFVIVMMMGVLERCSSASNAAISTADRGMNSVEDHSAIFLGGFAALIWVLYMRNRRSEKDGHGDEKPKADKPKDDKAH